MIFSVALGHDLADYSKINDMEKLGRSHRNYNAGNIF